MGYSSRPLVGAAAAALAFLFLCSGVAVASPSGGPSAHPAVAGPTPDQGSDLNADLNLSSATTVLNQSFWGTTVSARAPFFANESALINASGTNVALWPGAFAGDEYDPFNNQLYYSTNNYYTARTTEAEFVQWCESVHCTAIMELPGEINNATFAAEVVNYTEDTLGFTPALWEIGNEPGLWGHWSQSPATWADWTSWTGAPNAIQYAWEEWNYTQAIKPYHPNFKFIGIPGVGPGGVLYNWINATLALNGPNISGMAVHVYPDISGSDNSLSTFYHYLNDSNYNSIPARNPPLLNWISDGIRYSPSCQEFGCASIPVMYTEMGSAISGRSDGIYYSEGFPGGLFMAAEFVQAFVQNITTIEAYASVLDTANSWYTISGDPHPLYTIYSDFLSHLGPDVHTANFTVPHNPSVSGNLYATSTVDPAHDDREDLMVANLNLQNNVSFAPQLPGYVGGSPVEVWEWNGTNVSGPNGVNEASATAAPTAEYFPNGLPASWTLPLQSIALFEAYPGAAAPVQFTETGLPNGTRWFVGVGDATGSSETSNITFFLPSGSYSTVPGPAIGIPGHLATERWGPAPTQNFVVQNAALDLTIPYSLQYALNLTVSPAGTGSIASPTRWADVNSTVTLTASPAAGYAFVAWYGWGNGSSNGSANPTTVTVRAPLHERAIFDVGYAVNFEETGLPDGTPWSVTVRDLVLSGSSSTLTTAEPDGTFSYRIANVTGYKPALATGYVTIAGAPVTVDVKFDITQFPYVVSWVESGLPTGANWSLTVRDTVVAGSSATLTSLEVNGTYGFRVTNVSGYRVSPSSASVRVDGGPVTVTITFAPLAVDYPITWTESGLPTGTNWSVTVRGLEVHSTGTTIVLPEDDGTYTYYIGDVPNYRASPPLGGVTVNGGPVDVEIVWAFAPLPNLYPVVFQVTDPVPNATWSLSVAGHNESTSGAALAVALANGTWHFVITPPHGHFSVPGGGTLIVAGKPATIDLSFGVPSSIAVGPKSPGAAAAAEWSAILGALAVVIVIAVVGGTTYLLFTRRARDEVPLAASVPIRADADYHEDPAPSGSGVASEYHEDKLPQ